MTIALESQYFDLANEVLGMLAPDSMLNWLPITTIAADLGVTGERIVEMIQVLKLRGIQVVSKNGGSLGCDWGRYVAIRFEGWRKAQRVFNEYWQKAYGESE